MTRHTDVSEHAGRNRYQNGTCAKVISAQMVYTCVYEYLAINTYAYIYIYICVCMYIYMWHTVMRCHLIYLTRCSLTYCNVVSCAFMTSIYRAAVLNSLSWPCSKLRGIVFWGTLWLHRVFTYEDDGWGAPGFYLWLPRPWRLMCFLACGIWHDGNQTSPTRQLLMQTVLIEGSLEVKQRWENSEEKRRRKKIKKRKPQKKEDPGARKVENRETLCFSNDLWLQGVEK